MKLMLPGKSEHRRLVLECLLVFGGLPLVLLLWVPPSTWPALLATAGTICLLAWFARSPGVRHCWLRALNEPERDILPALFARFFVCTIFLVGLVLFFAPERLFRLPREDVVFWMLLIVSYPLFSVVPQEVVYRYLFRLRYRRLFARNWTWPSALAFAWLHIAFGNIVAPLLCLAGGWFFARTYRASRSLRLVVFEHTLYGVVVFSAGLEDFFLHSSFAAAG